MIQAACCCGFCKSSCAHRFFHRWTCEITTVVTTNFFRSRIGGDIGEVIVLPLPDKPGVEITTGRSVTTEVRNLSQSGTVYYTQGSKLRINNIEGANAGASRPPEGCEISFAGIPDLETSGSSVVTNDYERTTTLTDQIGRVTVCDEQLDEVFEETKDSRQSFEFPETGEGLECMNNTAPFMIPIIEGYSLTGSDLAYRAAGSDPECHPPNPGVFSSYPKCADAIGVHDFSGQAQFTVSPYEGMERDRFYFRRWKAMPLHPLYDNNQFFWWDDTAETYTRLERKNDKTAQRSGTRIRSADCLGGSVDETYSDQFPDGISNEIFRASRYDGVFPDGNCGVRDHLLGIWSEENGPPPSDPFGVNCVNSGPDPGTWEGGWGRGPLIPGRNVGDDFVPYGDWVGPYEALMLIGCPCTFPTPVPCDGIVDPKTQCPSDPEDPTAYPRVTAWEAWNALGGTATGPSTIEEEYPYYTEANYPWQDPPRTDIWSGTINVSISFNWSLDVSNVISSYDGVEIEAPCK